MVVPCKHAGAAGILDIAVAVVADAVYADAACIVDTVYAILKPRPLTFMKKFIMHK